MNKKKYNNKINKNKNNNNKINNQNLNIAINIIIAIFLICLILIKGKNIWFFIRNLYLGIFGINAIFLPFFIILIIFFKIKNNKVNKFKIILSCLGSVFFSAIIGIFYFLDAEKENFINYFYEKGLQSAGVLSGFLDFILIKLFGFAGSVVILFLILFLILIILFKINFYLIFNKIKRYFEILEKKIKKNKNKNNLDIKKNTREFIKIKEEEKKIQKIEIEKIKEKNNIEKNLDISNLFDYINIKISDYKFPVIDLLNKSKYLKKSDISDELNTNGKVLIDTLMSFNVKAKILDISRGPAITRYEIQPASGVKVSKITKLADDIALNLAAPGVRIEAPIPGKSAIGIEVPNKIVSTVTVREIIESKEFMNSKSKLTVALGKDISGKNIITDLGKMPHLLIAGSTGSGKSVCVNSFIISLLYKSSPDDVKFLLIDPKVVELGVYNGIPHLLTPVITDPKKSAEILNWAVKEMLNRYKIFADFGVRDILSYNLFLDKKNIKSKNKMPRIIIIIDELSDLMMAAPDEIEDYICRLTQMARAAGMHLVIATQRPSVNVITGVIKANIPSRIALAVSSQIDSRTILDMAGAEKLLGHGDMLFSPIGSIKPVRIQGCYVDEQEIEKVVNHIKTDFENKNKYNKINK